MFPWWGQAERLAAEIAEGEGTPPPLGWYRLGEASIGIASDDERFIGRFHDVYGDHLASPPDGGGAVVGCRVRSHPVEPFALVSVSDQEPLDVVRFVTDLFAARGFAQAGPSAGSWRPVARDGDADASWVFDGERVLVRRDREWEGLVANCLVHRAVRLQRGVLFLHAASVAVAGRGALLIGGKGSGKTTLSLAMAARGDGFLGDELGAVHLARRELLPVPRSVSVRHGPRDARMDRRLAELDLPPVRLPDGTERVRARPSAVCPGATHGAASLDAVVFLDGFAPVPAIARVPLRREMLARLNPLGSTLWGMSPAERVYRLATMLNGSALFVLRAGTPEATAELLATTLENT